MRTKTHETSQRQIRKIIMYILLIALSALMVLPLKYKGKS
ncbi:hypothetical protein SAMN05444406_14019 [Caldicoprobacter faecalis]|uniref:Uncharacterized protein n=1 Tax=Caldicoprobacter faecalis TaxID=937334 RepID=A0A1I5YB99_9FIRM|nr:hypothetical protein SAMN05444406_14019 [Caldicoprobacter faecalis]